MKKVVIDPPNTVHFSKVSSQKVYACNDNGTTLLIVADRVNSESYHVVSVTCGKRTDVSSLMGSLQGIIIGLIEKGYTVYEFDNEPEFGKWLSKFHPEQPSRPAQSDNDSLDEIVALESPSGIWHYLKKIDMSAIGGSAFFTTCCGQEVFRQSDGVFAKGWKAVKAGALGGHFGRIDCENCKITRIFERIEDGESSIDRRY